MQDRLPARCLGETRCAGERAIRWPDCSDLGLALIRVGLPERDSRQGCNGLTRCDMLCSSPACPWWPPPFPSCLANTEPEDRLAEASTHILAQLVKWSSPFVGQPFG